MYLSSRDIKWAIDTGRLIVQPRPEELSSGYDETSIDLHLDSVEEARIWDIKAVQESESASGRVAPEVHIGRFKYGEFSERYLILPPPDPAPPDELVFRRGPEVVVQPRGFLLWQTKERVGTPKTNPDLICFVDGKSTRARTGILVHLTAPTIHAGWTGKIVLEISNLGPFHFVLRENDVIAQLTVATISSPPDLALKTAQSATASQEHVTGRRRESAAGQPRKRRSK